MKSERSEVELVHGSELTVTTSAEFRERCSATHIWVDYANMPRVVSPGKRIYIDDGLISLLVLELLPNGTDIRCQVENGGKLGYMLSLIRSCSIYTQ